MRHRKVGESVGPPSFYNETQETGRRLTLLPFLVWEEKKTQLEVTIAMQRKSMNLNGLGRCWWWWGGASTTPPHPQFV